MNRLRRCFYDQLEGLHCHYRGVSRTFPSCAPPQEDSPQVLHLHRPVLPSAGESVQLDKLQKLEGRRTDRWEVTSPSACASCGSASG
jgi:hypothetical protein